ncbi:hypothetical protein F4604DRAFT_1717119 [Suillus subluteus]|nr:hypothetical protein F4604DRAFT_1717119 [Suillus subluteus]
MRLELIGTKISMSPPGAYPQAYMCPSSSTRPDQTLEISHRSSIIRQICSVGGYRDPIRASFELDRMLGNEEVIGKFDMGCFNMEMSIKHLVSNLHAVHAHLLAHGKSIPPTHCRYLPFSHAKGRFCGRLRTRRRPRRFAEYVTSGEVSHLNDAVEHFQLVLSGHPS